MRGMRKKENKICRAATPLAKSSEKGFSEDCGNQIAGLDLAHSEQEPDDRNPRVGTTAAASSKPLQALSLSLGGSEGL